MGRIKDIDVEMHELPDFEKGVQAERERIIRLLDEAFIYDEPVIIQRDRLIALIKNSGESKEEFVIPSRKNTNE